MANQGWLDAQAAPPAARAPVPGPVLFGRYAFGPNRLGYCGTDDHAALLGHAAAQDDRELRVLARTFEGAYPYLELIARSAGIADPLDQRVVEAYWLGNDLTAAVSPSGLHRSLDERFRGRVSAGSWPLGGSTSNDVRRPEASDSTQWPMPIVPALSSRS